MTRPSTTRPRLLLGAYATAPAGPSAPGTEAELYAGLRGLGLGAFELPLPAPGTVEATVAWVSEHLPPEADLVVTAIPRTMQRLADDPAYGLSSADKTSRRAALDDLADLPELARRLADAAGRSRITAVEVHSAPGPRHGSLDAFRRSVEELLTWDLAGARLLVEHCDALRDGQPPAKGFWPIADEIDVLRAVVADAPEAGDRCGVSVNWGRSAIEGRSADIPVEHVRAAAQAGLLRAVIFSGAASAPTPWGDAWGDQHIAPRGEAPALHLSAGSALGAEEIAATLDAARGADLDVVGVKVTVRPLDADVASRLAVVSASLDLVSAALASVGESAGE